MSRFRSPGPTGLGTMPSTQTRPGCQQRRRERCAFVERGIEGVKPAALGFIIIGDHPNFPWTHQVLRTTQTLTIAKGFCVAEMLHEFHRYHLDDSPELTSCCLVIKRCDELAMSYSSQMLAKDRLDNFYGANHPLRVHYVRDLTNGGSWRVAITG